MKGLPEGLQVGLVSLRHAGAHRRRSTSDTDRLVSGIDSLQVGSGTATAAGIRGGPRRDPGPAARAARQAGTGGDRPDERRLADDRHRCRVGPRLGDRRGGTRQGDDVPINTIAFGTPDGAVNVQGEDIPVPSDPAAMARSPSRAAGRRSPPRSADELGAMYDQIGRDVAYEEQPVDLTALFTGIGLAAALLACCAALYWNQRVV